MSDHDDLSDYEDEETNSEDLQTRAREFAAMRAANDERQIWEDQAARNRAIQDMPHEWDFVDTLRHFDEEFRQIDDPVPTDAALLNNYQNETAPTTRESAVETVEALSWHPNDYDEKEVLPKDEVGANFMKSRWPILGKSKRLWRGTKFLGKGTYGLVGLWEYSGPQEDLDESHRKVVVKQARISGQEMKNLDAEDRILVLLDETGSKHVVRRLAPSGRVQPGDFDEDRFVNTINRLYLEYCPLHSVDDLINWRHTTDVPFKEATLWKILHCLTDAMTVLERGNEHSVEDGSVEEGEVRRSNEYSAWTPLVHFDVKPGNAFLGDRTEGHESVPIVKIGDFGTTKAIENDGTAIRDHNLRRSGTPFFYTPEQFSQRWKYRNWETTGVAGRYSSKTNVWGIGCIMYQLVACSGYRVVDSKKPFRPRETMFSAPSKGLTYAPELRHEIHPKGRKYSATLIYTIWECLYEKPENRPTLLELKKRVVQVEKNIEPEDLEPWENFLVPTGPDIQPESPTPSSSEISDLDSRNSSSSSSSSSDKEDGHDGFFSRFPWQQVTPVHNSRTPSEPGTETSMSDAESDSVAREGSLPPPSEARSDSEHTDAENSEIPGDVPFEVSDGSSSPHEDDQHSDTDSTSSNKSSRRRPPTENEADQESENERTLSSRSSEGELPIGDFDSSSSQHDDDQQQENDETSSSKSSSVAQPSPRRSPTSSTRDEEDRDDSVFLRGLIARVAGEESDGESEDSFFNRSPAPSPHTPSVRHRRTPSHLGGSPGTGRLYEHQEPNVPAVTVSPDLGDTIPRLQRPQQSPSSRPSSPPDVIRTPERLEYNRPGKKSAPPRVPSDSSKSSHESSIESIPAVRPSHQSPDNGGLQSPARRRRSVPTRAPGWRGSRSGGASGRGRASRRGTVGERGGISRRGTSSARGRARTRGVASGRGGARGVAAAGGSLGVTTRSMARSGGGLINAGGMASDQNAASEGDPVVNDEREASRGRGSSQRGTARGRASRAVRTRANTGRGGTVRGRERSERGSASVRGTARGRGRGAASGLAVERVGASAGTRSRVAANAATLEPGLATDRAPPRTRGVASGRVSKQSTRGKRGGRGGK